MLGVGCRFSKENWTGSVLDVLSGAGNRLSVRLHRELLKICGETVKVLIKPISLNSHEYKGFGRRHLGGKTYGATKCVWAAKKSLYHTLKRPPSIGIFSSNGVSVK